MTRDRLYWVIGVLVVAFAIMAYLYYQEIHKRPGVEINVDKNGISIQGN